MKKRIKIAIIGCGGIARHAHISAYQQLKDDFEIVAACDIIEQRAQDFAKNNDIPRYFTDYHDVLNLEGLEAVDICTPNYMHSVIAVDALNKGIHVLCEKPDAVSIEEATKMKNAAEASGKLLMVIRNNRFVAQAEYLKKYIDDGNFGRIYAGRCGWQRRRGVPGRGGWFTTKSQSGGGPLIDLGVHMIDLTMWLMGNPKPVAVSACTYCEFAKNKVAESVDSAFGDQKAGGAFDVEDLAMGFIRFENGACLQIEFSWASNIQQDDKFFELRGTQAGANYHFFKPADWTDNRMKIFTEEYGRTMDLIPNLPNNSGSGHLGNIKNFADAIRGDAAPLYTPEQGLNMIKILEAIYKSAETGKEVIL